MIVQGTTPVLKFTLSGVAESNIASFVLSIKQGETKIEKTSYDYDNDSGFYEIELTQMETLKLNPAPALVQVKVKTVLGKVYATELVKVDFSLALYKEVL